MIRLFVELGVERDDAAIGVFELAIEVRELLLLSLQFVERAQQLLVLLLDLLHQAPRGCAARTASAIWPTRVEA